MNIEHGMQILYGGYNTSVRIIYIKFIATSDENFFVLSKDKLTNAKC